MHEDRSDSPPPPQPKGAEPDVGSLIRLPIPRDPAPPEEEWDPGRLAARSVRRRDEEDEDDEDDEEDEKPRARRKRPADDDDDDEDEKPRARRKRPADDDDDEDDEDEKPAKKVEKKKDKPKKKPAEEEEEPPRERKIPKKGTKRYQFYVVGNGLATLHVTLAAMFGVGGMASFHLVLFQLLQFDRPGGTMYFISQTLLIVLLCCLPVAFLAAESMLFLTPAKSDSRGPLIAAVSLQVLSLLLTLVCFLSGTLVSDAKLADRLREFMAGGANLAFWLGFLMLMTYIKQVYYYLGDKPSGNSASTLGLFFVLVIALGYALFYAGWALLREIDWLYMVLIPGWFLWDGGMSRCNLLLIRNLKQLRDKIDRYVFPPEEE